MGELAAYGFAASAIGFAAALVVVLIRDGGRRAELAERQADQRALRAAVDSATLEANETRTRLEAIIARRDRTIARLRDTLDQVPGAGHVAVGRLRELLSDPDDDSDPDDHDPVPD